jgi:hypothetical protein
MENKTVNERERPRFKDFWHKNHYCAEWDRFYHPITMEWLEDGCGCTEEKSCYYQCWRCPPKHSESCTHDSNPNYWYVLFRIGFRSGADEGKKALLRSFQKFCKDNCSNCYTPGHCESCIGLMKLARRSKQEDEFDRVHREYDESLSKIKENLARGKQGVIWKREEHPTHWRYYTTGNGKSYEYKSYLIPKSLVREIEAWARGGQNDE